MCLNASEAKKLESAALLTEPELWDPLGPMLICSPGTLNLRPHPITKYWRLVYCRDIWARPGQAQMHSCPSSSFILDHPESRPVELYCVLWKSWRGGPSVLLPPSLTSIPGSLPLFHPVCPAVLAPDPQWKWKCKSLSRVWLFVTPWTLQSTEFSRPEYWSG